MCLFGKFEPNYFLLKATEKKMFSDKNRLNTDCPTYIAFVGHPKLCRL